MTDKQSEETALEGFEGYEESDRWWLVGQALKARQIRYAMFLSWTRIPVMGKFWTGLIIAEVTLNWTFTITRLL